MKAAKSQDPKVERATTAATYLEQGRIWLPKKLWRGEWDAELVTFPHAKHDDQVDVLAYAAMQINKKRRRISMAGWRTDPDLRQTAGITTRHWR